MSKILSLLITFLFLAIGVLLGILNPSIVPFDLFLYQLHLPLSILLAIAFILGMIIGSLFMVSQQLKIQWQLKKLTKEKQILANEILELKKQSRIRPTNLTKSLLVSKNVSE